MQREKDGFSSDDSLMKVMTEQVVAAAE